MIESDNNELIESYVSYYNAFNVKGMLTLLTENIVFENESNGEVNARTEGKLEFEQLATDSAKLFSSRQQTITDISTDERSAMVSIDYTAMIAKDLDNGLKAGQVIELKGKTYFEFLEGKISYIKDIS
ncbi:nuclear transport factor 2 family protein [Thalassotalea ganghwensis]